MKIIKSLGWGWLLTGFLFSLSCSHKLSEIRIVPPTPEFNMLIASGTSDFKDRVRNKIIKKYKGFCEIHIIDIRSLRKVETTPYDVVVIMDTCLARSGLNLSVKSFLENEQNRRKTVLSMTAGNPDWQFSYKEVDAITSASLPANQDRFFSEIDTEIQQLLYNPN